MKKSLFIMLLLAAGCFGLKAQSDDQPAPTNQERRPKLTSEERAKQAADRLSAAVQLTPDQYAKVLEINKSFFSQQAPLRASARQGDENAKNTLKALGKEREEKTNALLSPEQRKKEQAARAAQHEQGHKDGHE